MSKVDLKKFNKEVAAYRRKHPHTSFHGAQKAVSRSRKHKPVRKKARRKKPSPKKRKKISGLRTVSKNHVDKNRFKNVDIQIGSVQHHMSAARKGLTLQYEKAQGRLLHAKTKPAKRKIRKTITTIKTKLRRLC